MTGGFTALPFLFCAALDDRGDTLSFGYVSDGQCIVRMTMEDEGHGPGSATVSTIDGDHEISVEWLPDGSVLVTIDETHTVIPRTEGV